MGYSNGQIVDMLMCKLDSEEKKKISYTFLAVGASTDSM